MANKLRALDWDTKMKVFALGSRLGDMLRELAQTGGPIDRQAAALLGEDLRSLGKSLRVAGITAEDFNNFLLHAQKGALEEALLSGAPSREAKKDIVQAFASAVLGLIHQGQLATQEAAERLAVAGRLQEGIA